MTLTIDARVAALLDSGLTADEIAESARQAAAQRARDASLASAPDGEDPAEVLVWLTDGKGSADVQAELALMADRLLANDPSYLNHARQALKNALIALPHILQQARQRKAEREGAPKDSRPSGAALDEAIRKHKENQQ